MTKIKKLAGETILYGLGSILPRFLNFLLVPLHTINTFEKAEYGDISKIYAFAAFVNVVYLFGMETAFFRFATKEGAEPNRVFNLAHTCIVLISVPLTVLMILLSPGIATSLGVGNSPDIIQFVALILLTDALAAIPFAQLRLQKKALQFATFKVINVLIQLGLNYYFLKVDYDPAIGIGYVFIANLIANLVYILFFIKPLISWRPAFDKKLSPAMLSYSYPVMLTGLAGMTNEMFSRLTLDWWLPQNFYKGQTNKEALGVFSACYKFGVFMNLGIQAFRYAAEPFFFTHASDKNSPDLFAKVNHYFVVVGCIVLFGVSVNLDILRYFIGDNYWSGLTIVPLLLMAYLFLGVYYNFSVWFKLTDKTHAGTWITAGGAIVTIAANYVLIPQLGYLGSAWAAVACYFLMALACYWLGQKNYPIPYSIGKDSLYILVTMILIILASYWTHANQWLLIGGDLIISALFVSIVFFIERRGLKS
ncbi:MAG: polysaccharide biosynthesis C-terminal domain-containing protein [Flammeovirgaceae bacterium]|nr:polysaccharide biosynthesis C-terminal domain-containing protein [Flammeovirgaceae bacterium]